MSQPLSRPFSAQDLDIWDQACHKAASATRGLGLEALARAQPLRWEGWALMARFPEPALRIPIAVASAQSLLRDAFGSFHLTLAPSDEEPSMDAPLPWGERQAEAAREAKIHAFARFEAEPLSRRVAQGLGARFSLDDFSPSAD